MASAGVQPQGADTRLEICTPGTRIRYPHPDRSDHQNAPFPVYFRVSHPEGAASSEMVAAGCTRCSAPSQHAKIRRRARGGASLRTLAAVCGVSLETIRRLLHISASCTLRPVAPCGAGATRGTGAQRKAARPLFGSHCATSALRVRVHRDAGTRSGRARTSAQRGALGFVAMLAS
jgi:hypothetical protein